MNVKPSAAGINHLEGEIVGEILNVDFLGPERAAIFETAGGVGQLQAIAIQNGVAVQLQPRGRKARAKIDGAGAAAAASVPPEEDEM